MAPPAQQAIDRLIHRLADDVPERDLDAADRRHHGRAALVLVADHPADDGLDVERVAAQHPPLDPLVQHGLDRPLLPLERRLADARQAGIGPQADEQVIPQPGVGQEGLEADDLQHGVLMPESVRLHTCRMTARGVVFKPMEPSVVV